MLGLAIAILFVGLLVYLIGQVDKPELERIVEKSDKNALSRLILDMPIEDETERSALLSIIREESTFQQLKELLAAA